MIAAECLSEIEKLSVNVRVLKYLKTKGDPAVFSDNGLF